MQNAKNAATRKRLYAAFVNRQAGPNTTLLEEAIRVRQECARELGYASGRITVSTAGWQKTPPPCAPSLTGSRNR